MSVSIKYKGNEIAKLTATGTKTLKTEGKYCEGNIVVENTESGGSGGEQPQLLAPTISVTEDLLTITPNPANGGFVSGWRGYAAVGDGDFTLFGTLPADTLTLDLTQQGLPPAAYRFKATAIGNNFIESAASNIVAYTNVFYAITKTLSNCSIDYAGETVRAGAFAATLTPSAGYTMSGATVTVTMGGEDITATAYSNGAISIAQVTGDLVITAATAVKTALEFVALADTTDQRLINAAYGNGKYVAVWSPSTGRVCYAVSDDGLTWSDANDFDEYNIALISVPVFANGAFYAYTKELSGNNDKATVRKFENGAWTKKGTNLAKYASEGIRYIGGQFVTSVFMFDSDLTNQRTEIYTSSDGITWTTHIVSPKIKSAIGAFWANGKYNMIKEESGTVSLCTTTDFETWEYVEIGEFTQGAFLAKDGLVIVFDRDTNNIYRSTDGVTFAVVENVYGNTSEIYRSNNIAASERFVVVIPNDYTNTVVTYSVDNGLTWQQTALPSGRSSNLRIVGDKFVSAKYGSYINYAIS